MSGAKTIKFFDYFAEFLPVPDIAMLFCTRIYANKKDLLAAGFILVSLEVIVDKIFQPTDTANKANRDSD